MATKEEIRADDIELATKLFSAYLAHTLGLKSIDGVRKRYVNSEVEIGSEWIDLARHIRQTLGIPAHTSRKQ